MPSDSPPENHRRHKRPTPVASVPPLLWRTSNYRCPFCLKVLKPLPVRGLKLFWAGLGFRESRCPHCFDVRWVPCHVMKYLIFPFRMIYLSFMEDVD